MTEQHAAAGSRTWTFRRLVIVGCLAPMLGCTSILDLRSPEPSKETVDSRVELRPVPAAAFERRIHRGQAPDTPNIRTYTKPAGTASISPTAGFEPRIQTASGNSLAAAPAAVGEAQVRIVAMVNSSPIYEQEVQEALKQRLAEYYNLIGDERVRKEQQIRLEELKRLIEREMIIDDMVAKLRKAGKGALLTELTDAAKKDADRRLKDFQEQRGIKNDDELTLALQGQGLTLSGLRRMMERSFMMMEYVRNLAVPKLGTITLANIRDYYEDHPAEFQVQESLKWMDIFVLNDGPDAQRHAEIIRRRAAAGEDFAALVKQFDKGDSSFRNGYGIGTRPGEIRPAECEPILLRLQVGEVGPLVPMPAGFHIVKVVERTASGRKPFNEATQAEIRRKLQGQLMEREYKRLVEEVKPRTNIVYMPAFMGQ